MADKFCRARNPPPISVWSVFNKEQNLAVGDDRVSVQKSAVPNRAAKARVFLCAVVMGMGLVVSVGLSQPIPDTILLPDSLWPLRRPSE
jgi:hypothetical protein